LLLLQSKQAIEIIRDKFLADFGPIQECLRIIKAVLTENFDNEAVSCHKVTNVAVRIVVPNQNF